MTKITVTGTFANVKYIPKTKRDKGIMFLKRLNRAFKQAKKYDHSLTLKVDIQ
jgi:hypothetical protein